MVWQARDSVSVLVWVCGFTWYCPPSHSLASSSHPGASLGLECSGGGGRRQPHIQRPPREASEVARRREDRRDDAWEGPEARGPAVISDGNDIDRAERAASEKGETSSEWREWREAEAGVPPGACSIEPVAEGTAALSPRPGGTSHSRGTGSVAADLGRWGDASICEGEASGPLEGGIRGVAAVASVAQGFRAEALCGAEAFITSEAGLSGSRLWCISFGEPANGLCSPAMDCDDCSAGAGSAKTSMGPSLAEHALSHTMGCIGAPVSVVLLLEGIGSASPKGFLPGSRWSQRGSWASGGIRAVIWSLALLMWLVRLTMLSAVSLRSSVQPLIDPSSSPVAIHSLVCIVGMGVLSLLALGWALATEPPRCGSFHSGCSGILLETWLSARARPLLEADD